MSADRTLQRVWYERSPLPLFLLLVPLSLLFGAMAALRRLAFRTGLLRSIRMSRPVLIVGNLSVGGTGKTPLVVWISHYLQSKGAVVGIITRGYGGNATAWPLDVSRNSSAQTVGDEALLLALRTEAIVVAGPDRVAAARRAIDRGAQVVISDDGLQHYRLHRDGEIIVVDGQRRFGNGWLLPAGPLRESISRLNSVDLVVSSHRARSGVEQGSGTTQELVVRHELIDAVNLKTGDIRPIDSFAASPVNAVAAIGNPDAFFAMLRERGINVNDRALPDHRQLCADDITFPSDALVLMTEKDAVKCQAFATERHWAVRLGLSFGKRDESKLATLLMKFLATSQGR